MEGKVARAELGLFSGEERKEGFIKSLQMKNVLIKNMVICFYISTGKSTNYNRLELQPGKINIDIKKSFLIMYVVKHWNGKKKTIKMVNSITGRR